VSNFWFEHIKTVIPGLDPGIHLDGRDKPGDDEKRVVDFVLNPLFPPHQP
jgi:hypothetical protein